MGTEAEVQTVNGTCLCGEVQFEVHVALANLEGPIDRAPASHVYVDHKAAWWEIADSLPQHGGDSGTEPK